MKPFGELSTSDFERHPVWVSCHVIDYDEPWYEETDEETFRPWLEGLPVDPAETMFLVRARFQAADGRTFPGFITPAESADLGLIQPQLFVGARRFGFWGGMFGVPESERSEFYKDLRSTPDQVFPIEFSAEAGLATGITSGAIGAFYRKPDLSSPPLLEL